MDIVDQGSPQVFLSYATPDRERVQPIYDWLKREGFDPWVDFDRILPGQDWDYEIRRAFDKSSLVLTFISNTSVVRRSYLQREVRLAIDKRLEQLRDDISLIPILLDDDVAVPDELAAIQSISVSNPAFEEKLSNSLKLQFGRLGVELAKVQRQAGLSWTISRTTEFWEGLPGYEVSLEFIQVRSETRPHLNEIGDLIRGRLLTTLFRHRAGQLRQSTEFFNFGQERYHRINTFDAHCGQPIVKGRVLTIPYSISWYGAGAAHSNYHLETYAFVLEPLHLISELQDVFVDPENAFATLQSEVREQLSKPQHRGGGDEGTYTLNQSEIDGGTSRWEDLSAFIFGEKGLECSFAPYQVGPFAFGFQTALVPYSRILNLVRPEYQSALEVTDLRWRH